MYTRLNWEAASEHSGKKISSIFEPTRRFVLAVADAGGPVNLSLEEVAVLIEDLMRIADDLLVAGDEVKFSPLGTDRNAFLPRHRGGPTPLSYVARSGRRVGRFESRRLTPPGSPDA